ncbi:MAG: calcium/sodium antiporter [Cellvibrionaceae bacterium]
MLDILLPWIAILVGFAGLIWSADRFVDGSATIASNFGVSKLIVGLTVVAFGTSAPEVIVSISSSLSDAGDLAVGNALGSNLANVGMVLGITALIAPLPIKKHILKEEFLIMLAIMALSGFFLYDGKLHTWEGMVLICSLLPLLLWIAYSKKNHPEDVEDLPDEMPTRMAIVWFILGLSALIVSAEILVWGAKAIAISFGVSPLVIGLTIVAVGTSLPELAASVMSALKGHHDIAIGNVIGSNIFNLLLVMGIAPIISPIVMDTIVFTRDFAAMAFITLVLGGFMLISYLKNKRGTSQLGRLAGLILLILYGAYYTLLF